MYSSKSLQMLRVSQHVSTWTEWNFLFPVWPSRITAEERLRAPIKTQITHIFIDVEERCHGGITDGSQIWLVPVDVEHSSYSLAACRVAGHVLQQERLLTTRRHRGSINTLLIWLHILHFLVYNLKLVSLRFHWGGGFGTWSPDTRLIPITSCPVWSNHRHIFTWSSN